MTSEQMIERYDELYEKMKDSKDVKNMKIFGKAASYMFMEMTKVHPEIAERWLTHLEPICWKNYLSATEAVNIGKTIINQDGMQGFHWGHDAFVSAIKQLGGVPEEKPYYNSYALCVTANMIYSDMAHSIAEDMGYKTVAEVPNEKMALSCYKKAVAYLKDKDENFSIRHYFKHRMYDDDPLK